MSITMGCGAAAAPRGCTAIGGLVGLTMDVKPPDAARAAEVDLKVCWDGACRTPEMPLMPSSDTSPIDCSGDGPDDVCGAVAVPNGGRYGIAAIPGLPAKPVRVTVVLRDSAGKRSLNQTITVTPRVSHPNGPDCGGQGMSATLLIEDGLLRAEQR